MTNVKVNQTVFLIDDLTNRIATAIVTEIENDRIQLIGTNTVINQNYTKYMRNINDIYATAEEAAAHQTHTDIPYPTEAELRQEMAASEKSTSGDYVEF